MLSFHPRSNPLFAWQPQHKATAALVCWNRRRHTIFGGLVNRVLATFLLGSIRVVCIDNLVVPDADPETVKKTLESFHRFDLESHTLAQILAAGSAATSAEEKADEFEFEEDSDEYEEDSDEYEEDFDEFKEDSDEYEKESDEFEEEFDEY